MLLALGLVVAVSGALTWYILKSKDKKSLPPDTFAAKEYDYKGVRPHDFIKNRPMFYPYNYVNG